MCSSAAYDLMVEAFCSCFEFVCTSPSSRFYCFFYSEFRLYSLELVCSACPYFHKHHSGCQKSQLSLAEVDCFRQRHCILADASGSCKEHHEMFLLAFIHLGLHVACQLKTLLSHPYAGALPRVMSITLKNILTKDSVICLLPI